MDPEQIRTYHEYLTKGPFIKDVRTEGEGDLGKIHVELKLCKGGCMNMRTRGRGF